MKKENYKFLLVSYVGYFLVPLLNFLIRGKKPNAESIVIFLVTYTTVYLFMVLWQNIKKKKDSAEN